MRLAKGLLVGAVALVLAAAGSAAVLTEFTLTWVDDPADTPVGIVLDPSPIKLGMDDASTNNFDIGIDAEVPPAPPGPWVQLVSYTDDYVACLLEYRPGTPDLEVYFFGEIIPTGFTIGKQAGDSWLEWDVDPGVWEYLTITIDGDPNQTYNMLVDTQAYVYVGRTYGPFYEINGKMIIPEPGTLALLGTGLAGLVALARKR